MPTYTIVDKDKDPLGPNEVNAGTKIEPADGDVFIIDPSVDANVEFEYSSGGTPPIFEVQINATPSNSFSIKIVDDLSVDISVADNVDAADIKLDAKETTELNFDAGDNVSFGQFDGSTDGINTVVLGDDFTTDSNWKFGSDDDILIVGDNATFKDIDAGDGDDTITFGSDATVNNVDAKGGDDTLTFKLGLTGNDIKGSDGDDTFNIGADAEVNKFDGGGDFDTLNTKSPSETSSNMEDTNIVCFGHGTMIETEHGPVPVEALRIDQQIVTLDHGLQPLRWVGHTSVSVFEQLANPKLRPIRICVGSLGPDVPARDLFVSPNHRILIRSPIVERMFGSPEVFVPAKKLTSIQGIEAVLRPTGIRYYHLLFDRHEALVSESAISESLFLGKQSQILMGEKARKQVAQLQQRNTGLVHDHLSRQCCEKTDQILHMIDRHKKNKKALFISALPSPANRSRVVVQCD